MADPGPAPADWKPDAVLSLSEAQLDAILAEALREGGALHQDLPIKGPLGVKGTVTPNLVIDSLALSPSKACKSCLAVDAELSGDVGWTLGPARGTFPLTARIGLDTQLDAVRSDEGWEVRAVPEDVRKAEVDIGRAGSQVKAVAEQSLREWVGEALEQRSEPIVLASFAKEELPLRALRVDPRESGLRVEMLTLANSTVAAKPMSAMPTEGWRLEIARESLLAIAKRTSFEAGPVSHDVVIEPTGISLTENRFDLDMRLWRIKGKGWWRDYHTEGDVTIDGARIQLTPTEVEERGKSPGAVLVDPLAALGHGVILKAIEDSLETSLPGIHKSRTGARLAEVRIQEVDGTGAMLRLGGSLAFKDAPPVKKKPGPAKKKP